MAQVVAEHSCMSLYVLVDVAVSVPSLLTSQTSPVHHDLHKKASNLGKAPTYSPTKARCASFSSSSSPGKEKGAEACQRKADKKRKTQEDDRQAADAQEDKAPLAQNAGGSCGKTRPMELDINPSPVKARLTSAVSPESGKERTGMANRPLDTEVEGTEF
mmetsp:Transcript_829/g.1797  ORF Transcript_829/g.1797 Transcript_829/m.1797 type:complete len:160 (+) Transcript_829:59-538(+)